MSKKRPVFDLENLENMNLRTLVLGDLPKIRQARKDLKKEFRKKYGETQQIHRVVETIYENRPGGKWVKIEESRGRDHIIAWADYESVEEILYGRKLEESVQSVIGVLTRIIEKKREAEHGNG